MVEYSSWVRNASFIYAIFVHIQKETLCLHFWGSSHGMHDEMVVSRQYWRASLRNFLVFIARLLVVRWNDLSLQQPKCDGQWIGVISFDEDISLRILSDSYTNR